MDQTGLIGDLIGSLAVLALLASSYGALGRRIVGPDMAPVALGALFGLLALAQMHRPLEIAPGLIIDMRNVPIVLAGAFLGWRGLVPCLFIAMATRLGIGGVGASAGVVAMAIAGSVGLAWNRLAPPDAHRTLGALGLLGAAANLHLLGALVLPPDMAVLIMSTSAPTIIALNIIIIPLIGALLETERRAIRKEKRLALAAKSDPDTGLLTEPAFLREIAHLARTGGPEAVHGVMIVRLKWDLWFSRRWGQGTLTECIGAVGRVLEPMVAHGGKIGVSRQNQILIPITLDEMARSSTLGATLMQEVSWTRVALSGGVDARPRIEVRLARVTHAMSMADLSRNAKPMVMDAPKPCSFQQPVRSQVFRATAMVPPISADEAQRLFDKADLYMEAR